MNATTRTIRSLTSSRNRIQSSRRMSSLRLGILQFTPTHSDPSESSERVESLCRDIPPNSLDILIAPEMCLTGYRFDHPSKIQSLCEDVVEQKGVTLDLAKRLSRSLGCYTLFGFPERANGARKEPSEVVVSQPFDARSRLESINTSSQENPTADQGNLTAGQGDTTPESERYYNSAILTSPTGELLHSFRKHFLFTDDKIWCQEGPGFQSLTLKDAKIGIGICMDLNPYEFKTDFERYEFGTWCADQDIRVILMPMAWLSSGSSKGDIDIDTIEYWAQRCQPLWKEGEKENKTWLVTANRTGSEGDVTFAGSSAVLQFQNAKQPTLLAVMGRDEERVMTYEIDLQS
ncbi:unnamed protein product [Sympodiomycopsis kandeliae]